MVSNCSTKLHCGELLEDVPHLRIENPNLCDKRGKTDNIYKMKTLELYDQTIIIIISGFGI